MATQNKRRWLPRFSMRTFLVMSTLLCCYAACWWPTKMRGRSDVARSIDNRDYAAEAVFPLLVESVEIDRSYEVAGVYQRYYFWFFGYVAKLPYERDVTPSEYPAFDFEVKGHTGRTGSYGQF